MIFLCVFICSSASRLWVPLPGRCFDQAQQGRQYSRCCLHATAGQCEDKSLLPVNTCVAFCCQSGGVLLSTGRIDPAVWRDHEGKHQHQERVWLLRLCQHLWAGLRYEEVRVKSH